MKNKTILLFDTATTACSVALIVNDNVFHRHRIEANIHSKVLLTMIDELLVEANLYLSEVDCLAIGVGPGSFTGLRIGIGVAQGVAYSNNIPLITLSTLEMIAVNTLDKASEGSVICVGHDARMSEMYFASFEYRSESRMRLIKQPTLSQPGQMSLNDLFVDTQFYQQTKSHFILCGNAWKQYQSSFDENELDYFDNHIDPFPVAEKAVRYVKKNLSEFDVESAVDISPLYVRNDVAKKSVKLR